MQNKQKTRTLRIPEQNMIKETQSIWGNELGEIKTLIKPKQDNDKQKQEKAIDQLQTYLFNNKTRTSKNHERITKKEQIPNLLEQNSKSGNLHAHDSTKIPQRTTRSKATKKRRRKNSALTYQ